LTQSEYLSLILILIQRQIQTQIMHNEKFQDTIHATGLEEVGHDPPVTSSSVNQPSGVNNMIVVPSHR
jgi:hypothetical protein